MRGRTSRPAADIAQTRLGLSSPDWWWVLTQSHVIHKCSSLSLSLSLLLLSLFASSVSLSGQVEEMHFSVLWSSVLVI